MHSTHAPGYSDFFTSGIRVISRRTAMQKSIDPSVSPKPIPLSFDGVHSDSDAENVHLKRRTRRSSIFIPFSKPPLMPSSASAQSRSQISAPKKHQRSASLMSHIFRSRNPRKPSPSRAMSNDESGWLSSASSDAPFEDDNADFMDLSNWPECPNNGIGRVSRPVSEILSEPEILDPFSSSPSSKSFFVDVGYCATAPFQRDNTIPFHRRRTSSMSNWSNRLSFSSLSSTSSSSFFSSSRRNSSTLQSFLAVGSPSSSNPSPNTSFLHIPRVRTGKRSSVERKRPASIHVMTTSEYAAPVAVATVPPPITVERRSTEADNSTSSRPLLCTFSHTRSRSAPLSQPQARSRVRSLFISKPSSISAAIPESDLTDNDNGPNDSSDIKIVSACNPVSNLNPELQVPDRVWTSRDGERTMGLSGLMIVDEEAPASASDAREFFGSVMDADVPKRVDWRQFCIEILDGHTDA